MLSAAAVLVMSACGSSEEAQPTTVPAPAATPTPASLPATAAPAPKYTNPDTGESCANVITQAEIVAAAASALLTLPFAPCARMDKPPYYQNLDEGQIFYYYVSKGTPIVSPFAGELIGRGDTTLLYGRGDLIHVIGETYTAYLIDHDASFDESLFGTRVQRGQVIGYMGDPLEGAGTDSPSFGMDIIYSAPPQDMLNISEPQHWAGGQPSFFVP